MYKALEPLFFDFYSTKMVVFFLGNCLAKVVGEEMKTYLRRVSKKVKNGKNGKKGRKILGVFDQKKSEGSWVQS